MTAPDLPAWTVAEDGWGDPTIWTDGDHAVATRWGERIRIDPAFTEQVWPVLTAVLAPDEATVERVAMELTRWNYPPDPFFVIRGRSTIEAEGADPYALIVKTVLRALAGTSAQARYTDDDDKTEATS